MRCLYPGCKATYVAPDMTTTGINTRLRKVHHITGESGVNDGSLSRRGPLDSLLQQSRQPEVFDPTKYDDLLVRFVVTTKQPFSIVRSQAFQDLLNHATMATVAQVQLPSQDTMAKKVYICYCEKVPLSIVL